MRGLTKGPAEASGEEIYCAGYWFYSYAFSVSGIFRILLLFDRHRCGDVSGQEFCNRHMGKRGNFLIEDPYFCFRKSVFA